MYAQTTRGGYLPLLLIVCVLKRLIAIWCGRRLAAVAIVATVPLRPGRSR